MIALRPAGERGTNKIDWLETYFTFSFDRYHDPNHMGFRDLRVMNEDTIAPGGGFPLHPHRDMEIITYILEGQLEHKDSMGNGSVIGPGQIQRMTAGSGVTHSEFNHSQTEPVHLYQIWILPQESGLEPGYEDLTIDIENNRNEWTLLVSPGGEPGTAKINQDVRLYATHLDAGEEVARPIPAGRHAWAQVISGSVMLNGEKLGTSDGAAISEEDSLSMHATEDAEVLLFDLA
jgi:redox-sensitive bicupin YhaK (pirin superfamily)